MPEWLENLLYNTSKSTMLFGRSGNDSDESGWNVRENETPEGEALATYLLPRTLLRKRFLKAGYIEGTSGDYGLVKKAVGTNNFPVYLTAPDAISRDLLIVIGNEQLGPMFASPRKTWLQHAGDFPSAIYTDSEGNLYQKSWDLNDYGNSTGREGTTYGKDQWMANFIDKIGSPVVVTTGFLPLYYYNNMNNGKSEKANLLNAYSNSTMIQDFIKSRGLVPYYGDFYGDERDFDPKFHVNGNAGYDPQMFTLPEVTVTVKRKKK